MWPSCCCCLFSSLLFCLQSAEIKDPKKHQHENHGEFFMAAGSNDLLSLLHVHSIWWKQLKLLWLEDQAEQTEPSSGSIEEEGSILIKVLLTWNPWSSRWKQIHLKLRWGGGARLLWLWVALPQQTSIIRSTKWQQTGLEGRGDLVFMGPYKCGSV